MEAHSGQFSSMFQGIWPQTFASAVMPGPKNQVCKWGPGHCPGSFMKETATWPFGHQRHNLGIDPPHSRKAVPGRSTSSDLGILIKIKVLAPGVPSAGHAQTQAPHPFTPES